MRTPHQTARQLAVERAIATAVEKKRGTKLLKLPDKWVLDFAVHDKNNEITCYIEIRTLTNTYEQVKRYGGYFLNVNKWLAAKHYYEALNKPTVVIVRTSEGRVSYLTLTEFPNNIPHCITGRADRGDPDDREPAFKFKIENLKFLLNFSDEELEASILLANKSGG